MAKGEFWVQPAEVIDTLKKVRAYEDMPCSTLPEVRDATDLALSRLGSDQQLWLAMQLLGVYPEQRDTILARHNKEGEPPMSSFAPYVEFVLRIELFYHIAVHKGRMSVAQRMDMVYLFYLPFCQLFVSTDWVHRDCAPLF